MSRLVDSLDNIDNSLDDVDNFPCQDHRQHLHDLLKPFDRGHPKPVSPTSKRSPEMSRLFPTVSRLKLLTFLNVSRPPRLENTVFVNSNFVE
jgi:hypothetical protein